MMTYKHIRTCLKEARRILFLKSPTTDYKCVNSTIAESNVALNKEKKRTEEKLAIPPVTELWIFVLERCCTDRNGNLQKIITRVWTWLAATQIYVKIIVFFNNNQKKKRERRTKREEANRHATELRTFVLNTELRNDNLVYRSEERSLQKQK